MFDRFIADQARRTPEAVAISMPAGDVSFADFDLAVGRMAAAIAGEPRASLVAVRVLDPYFRWLVVLALARLGIASTTVLPPTESIVLPLLRADLVIADVPAPDDLARGLRWIHATPERARAILERSDVLPSSARREVDPEAIGQVVTSSGSTGLPKPIALSWRRVDARMRNWRFFVVAPGSLARVLPVLGAGSRSLCLAAWAGGGRVLFDKPDADTLARLRPTCIVASPVQLQALLDALPPDFAPLPELHVTLIGSHAPLPLRRDALRRLTPNIAIAYGTNETDIVALGTAARLGDDAAACGRVLPFAEAEVVDEAGRLLPPGESGLLRFRGPEIVERYHDETDRSASFAGGWYHTGDVGTLSALGALRVEGRADERMNFGGVKMLPRLIEEVVLSCPGVRDAAAFAVPDPSGLDRPWLALVRDADADGTTIGAALRERLPGLPLVRLVAVDAIPRNANGKIERRSLREAAEARTPI